MGPEQRTSLAVVGEDAVDDPAEAIAVALSQAGTRLAFGVPGGGNNLALVEACGRHGIDFVLCHGETAAVIAAATYGELTGSPGLALATRGPGAVSAANGSAHALLDRAPVVVVTDAISHADRPRVTHQLVEHAALFRATAKASIEIGASPHAAAEHAVALALQPPWGPVHLDVVADAPPSAASSLEPPTPNPSPTTLPASWAERLTAATRPLLLVGVGAREARHDVAELVAATGVPALCTYKAKGIVPETSPAFAGLLTGAAIESDALAAADVLICLGLDPVELIPGGWPYDAPVLSATPWPIVDTYVPHRDEIVSPLQPVIGQLRLLLDGKGWTPPKRGLGLADAIIRSEIDPATLVERVRAAAPANTIATVDAGAHMLVTMPLWTVHEPGQALISSGLATMGFALPAAIAAALNTPGQRVVCLTGDGGLGMCLAELETLARRELDVLVVVFNDSTLSLIDIKQRAGRGGSAVTYTPTDFAAIARASGLAATSCRTTHELEQALSDWAHRSGPRLLDVQVDPAQYPQVLRTIRGT